MALTAAARLTGLEPERVEQPAEVKDHDGCDEVWLGNREGLDFRLAPQPPPPFALGDKFYSLSACSAQTSDAVEIMECYRADYQTTVPATHHR